MLRDTENAKGWPRMEIKARNIVRKRCQKPARKMERVLGEGWSEWLRDGERERTKHDGCDSHEL